MENKNKSEEGSSTSSGRKIVIVDSRQWLCEHYQQLCRVKIPSCGKFFPCHRCNNSSGCPNTDAVEREAYCVECSVCDHQQEERVLEAERRLKTTASVVESLDSTHNSFQALVQGVRDARLRISARNTQFRRRWHTCVGQGERDLEAERRLKTTTCVVESLDSTHNSFQALVQGVRDARLRILARNTKFRRRWHTCVGRENLISI
ncbi:uncharacterized protein LOC111328741 isoform X2 [Stylophora pistillata]|uniref:uncharacterized protein LOC111328741 isoform X2 n=1 Tax=Stylophora pistillata TaxID=50429 RepID=UPI000C03D3EB|nr:uncharacterized protein LOC111328741 isoform X2 [Stylophora pistillata]